MGASQSQTHGDRTNGEDWLYVSAIREPEFLDWRRRVGATEKEGLQEMLASLSQKQNALPVQISDTVFLSDAKGAANIERLKELGITHVLNVAGQSAALTTAEMYKEAGIVLKMLSAEDEEGYPMLATHLTEARAFIQTSRNEGGKCVVHCVAGINRSGVIVAAEKMLTERINVLESVGHCRKQRGNACLWNKTFQEELVALARKEGLLGPKPGDPGCIVSELPPKPEKEFKKPSFKTLFNEL